MYIRKTKIKSGRNGEPYYTYWLAESVRTGNSVRQRTLINLGKHFDVDPEHWPAFSTRVEQILNAQSGQVALFDLGQELGETLEASAQRTAALVIHKYAQPVDAPSDSSTVEVDCLTREYRLVNRTGPPLCGGQSRAAQGKALAS